MQIKAEARFAHSRYRGYRVPNQYSVKDPEELRSLGVTKWIDVINGRELNPPPTLDSHGFQLLMAPTKLDLMDNDIVRSQYYEQCREMLLKATGCQEVRGGGHEYRNGFGGESGPRGVKPTPNGSGGAYALGIHADMCAVVEDAFRRIIPDERHFESINIWRSTKLDELIETMPLAVCDMRSIDPNDIVFGDGMNTGNIKQYTKVVDQRIVHSPEQKWYYFPDMSPDEVLIFRQYDTRQETLNLRTVFHQAVKDPNTRSKAPMRSTIEVRMQAIYGAETNKADRVARFKKQISSRYSDGSDCDWWSGPIEGYRPPQ
ncbi:uncharacterized protein METZ01_LOCUS160832 [marine metagenome]|uniref:TauD/TfdA-like domain-containing protein n=1 Tax=marine metagenome TaxID=408172 RepID=A0A382B2K6_9ZZZZ